MMAEWIVVVATACGGMNLTVPTGNDLAYRIPVVDPPRITVYRCPTKEGAEERALYPEMGFGCSRSAIVITPDGKAYEVKSVEKKRKVLREVEESEGWETRWTEVRP